jgi:hypothetical protein
MMLPMVGFGGAQAVFEVFVALANDLQVQREHQCAAARGFGALNHAHHGVAVAHHVELEPKRRGGVLRHVFDGANAHGGQCERDAEFLGRARSEDFTVGVLHAGQTDRRNRDGHGDVWPTIIRLACVRFSMFTATRWRNLIDWKSSLRWHGRCPRSTSPNRRSRRTCAARAFGRVRASLRYW